MMPCVLQLDSDAEVSDSLGKGTEGASQSHTAPYSQTPADSLGGGQGQDDRDYHPVLGDDVTSRGAGKRAYGTRSKGRRSVRPCLRAIVVIGAVMRVSNGLPLELECFTRSVHAHRVRRMHASAMLTGQAAVFQEPAPDNVALQQ